MLVLALLLAPWWESSLMESLLPVSVLGLVLGSARLVLGTLGINHHDVGLC